MNKEIILADNAGFCFGVKRAVDEALKVENKYNKKIYTLGPLIHNDDAVSYLKSNNIYPINLEDIKDLSKGDVVIIRSHGVAKYVYDLLEEKGLVIEDATCPYVTNIQKKAKKYYDLGYGIIIVGDKNHPEVIGINGWCNNSAIIYKNHEFSDIIPNKVCIVSQTTEKQGTLEEAIAIVSKQCKEFIVFNTICSATEQRQKSASEISKEVNKMIVIGGKHSSNTTKLYEICKSNCESTIHIERAEEIPKEYINSKDNKIGVTAGASTPDWIIKEALNKMSDEKIMDMNDVLNYMDNNSVNIHIGQKLTGKIISVSKDGVYLNLNYKSEGFVPKSELGINDDTCDLKTLFNDGEEIECKVIKIKNEFGNVVLSRVEIENEHIKEELKQKFEEKANITVVASNAINGGILCKYKGVSVFLPASLVDLKHTDDLSKYEKQELTVRIVEFVREGRKEKIVASRKILLLEEAKIKSEESWNTLEVGNVYEGEVKRIANFGAFVNVNGIDGLLHLSEISWGKVENPKSMLKIGEKINVKVIGLNKEESKLALSIKALTNNPWENVEENYPTGTIALGKVVRFTDFGAFVELEPGVDGLVHISQISHNKVEKPQDALTLNENIKVKILDVKSTEKRIALSIKAVE